MTSFSSAVVARLAGGFPPENGFAVYKSIVPKSPARKYLVVRTMSPRDVSGVSGESSDGRLTVYVTCAAAQGDSASDPTDTVEAMVSRVQSLLTGWAPAFAGAVPGPLSNTDTTMPDADESISDRTVVFAVARFTGLADLS